MRWNLGYTLAVIAFVVLYASLGVLATQLELTPHNHLGFWSLILVGLLLLSLMVVLGFGVAGRFDGILVDSRNRVTLANFQLVVWTLVVLASLGGAFFTNLLAGVGAAKALDVSVPPELWLAIGLSGTTFVGAKGIGVLQGSGAPDVAVPATHPNQPALAAAGILARGRLAVRADPRQANWSDLFVSDQLQDNMTVDIAKVQMFFFTVMLAFGYGVAVANVLINPGSGITALPGLNNGFITLLAISQGTYIVGKAAKGT